MADKMNPHSSRFRFGLRSLFALVFVVAIFAAFPILLHVLVWLIWFTGPSIAIFIFLITRNATYTNSPTAAERWPRLAGWLVLACAAIPFVACWFIRYRWITAFSDDRWPRPFPYPDVYLLQIHDCWDRLHPVTDGIKIHGEYYAVLQDINTLVLIACVAFGALAGFLFRDGDFIAAARRIASYFRTS